MLGSLNNCGRFREIRLSSQLLLCFAAQLSGNSHAFGRFDTA
jgi:hypothetical protein